MVDDEAPGHAVVRVAVIGTGLLVAASLAAALWPSTFSTIDAVLSGVLFVIGSGAMLWAYARGISRSRADLITISGLFFLAGQVAPRSIRRVFWLVVTIEVVAVFAAGFARPYGEVAFGILAPMYGLGLMSVWGARHGSFPPRPPGS